MQTEPPDSATPKRKRRWFQFSLRTPMIVVTMLAVTSWGMQDRQRLIRERDDAIQSKSVVKKYAMELDAVSTAYSDLFSKVKHPERLQSAGKQQP
jgi:hypothetical protein